MLDKTWRVHFLCHKTKGREQDYPYAAMIALEKIQKDFLVRKITHKNRLATKIK